MTTPLDGILKAPQSSTAPEKPFNIDELFTHIAAVRENQKQYIGKAGFNPFLFVNEHVVPLEDKLKQHQAEGTTVPYELVTKVLALSTTHQPIAKGAEHNVGSKIEHQAAGAIKTIIPASTVAANAVGQI